jgi:N6-L-threonylcarbamoyladenine synthase
MTDTLTVLGLESSCDDSAAAVVRLRLGADGAPDGPGEILSNIVWGQNALHAPFGGVVPEIAARAHVERLDRAAAAALEEAGLAVSDLDGVAATAGPGLIGGVLVCAMTGKGVAWGAGLPFIGVNHLEGHVLTPRLTDGLAFPYLSLLVSGGHCQLIAADGLGAYAAPRRHHRRRAGRGLRQDRQASRPRLSGRAGGGARGGLGRPARFAFPRPLLDRKGCDMSFSGLKTAVRRASDKLVAAQGGLTRADRADLCASFQAAVADALAEKAGRAMAAFAETRGATTLCVAGGVAANGAIRAALEARAAEGGFRLPRAAAEALHRQRRDDRLGRGRTPRPRRALGPRPARPPALAARRDGAAALRRRQEGPEGLSVVVAGRRQTLARRGAQAESRRSRSRVRRPAMRRATLLTAAFLIPLAALAQRGGGMAERLEMLDGDGDGLIQRAELMEFREGVFYAMDADGDDSLTREEYMAVQFGQGADPDARGPRYAEMQAHKEAEYDAMDSDGDDAVDLDMFMGFAEANFDAGDADGDGALTPAEFRSMHGM